MKNATFKWLVAAVAALGTGSAWAEILISTAGPMTGQYASFGEQMRRGAEMAVSDINARGGVLGQQLKLTIGDDACDPKQAVAVANKFVSEGVAFVNRFCQAYGLGIALLMLFAADSLARLFTENQAALDAAGLYLNIVPWTYGFLGMSMAANSAFNAIGKPMAAMFVSLSRTLMVYVPLAWILSQFFGLVGIFAAAAEAGAGASMSGLIGSDDSGVVEGGAMKISGAPPFSVGFSPSWAFTSSEAAAPAPPWP